MMKKTLAVVLFIFALFPLYLIRRFLNISRFSKRFHQGASGWDHTTTFTGE
ncbi:hypothetical protein [Pantoea ananatis]|uniref:hypothetical protein n=1 Tax=Pantoea ananas TaxID=553 RepID=UPI00041ECAC2|nr:hypothetical protein [Pantoea ananatis]